ncbi:MAG: ketol-acid reductoisomerase [Phycisphaerae bacterium]|nr:MAG: ketol-acid reductoisomerase [Planctomycetota bacterium]MBE7456618.1 ketol-acid reductoisomerase [Planctomycetia bacterium]MCL4718217.1 ketol-acid reductoisomerase [Phycisphaerae bacterium]
MNTTVYRNGNTSRLKGLAVAVIGYGNQGAAHALNLRDSGVRVIVGQRPGAAFDRAREAGFSPVPAGEAAAQADLVILALPDETAGDVYAAEIAPALRPGAALGFIHGFNIHFGFITPRGDGDVVLVGPKGPGSLLRSLYLEDRGLPALAAVAHDASGRAFDLALAWAAAIGCTRAGVLRTTFAEETETDLFGEQAVLCGGVSALTQAAFETLVDAGYSPESAYLECVHELKQIADLIYAQGLAGMRARISNTAEYGDRTRGPRIIGEPARAEMRRVLAEICDGTFAREWINEARRGAPILARGRREDREACFERVGAFVRSLMPWLAG